MKPVMLDIEWISQSLMEQSLQAVAGNGGREFTPVDVNGWTLIKSFRELQFIKDVIRLGHGKAAKKYGLHRQTVWRYLNKEKNLAWLQDEISKAAANASVDVGWIMREFKRIVEGKRDADKIIVESLKNMAKIIGAYKNTNYHLHQDIELVFEGENGNSSIQDTIETTCEPAEGTQQ